MLNCIKNYMIFHSPTKRLIIYIRDIILVFCSTLLIFLLNGDLESITYWVAFGILIITYISDSLIHDSSFGSILSKKTKRPEYLKSSIVGISSLKKAITFDVIIRSVRYSVFLILLIISNKICKGLLDGENLATLIVFYSFILFINHLCCYIQSNTSAPVVRTFILLMNIGFCSGFISGILAVSEPSDKTLPADKMIISIIIYLILTIVITAFWFFLSKRRIKKFIIETTTK